MDRFRTRLSLEALDAREMPSATPVAAVAGALTGPLAYSATSMHVFRGATTHDTPAAQGTPFAESDFLADDIQFSVAQRVESFAFRYRADVPLNAVVTFHSVDQLTGGPGAEVASFRVDNLPATGALPTGSSIRSVVLPEAARFTWEPTAGIYKNYANGFWGPDMTGGFLSVRFEQLDGTPFNSPTGGQIAARTAGPTTQDNLANGTGTVAGFWDLQSNLVVAGTTDQYQPSSMWLQVGAKPANAPPVGAPQLIGFSLSADTIRGGQSLTGTITLSAPAPAGGTFIRLTSNRGAVSAPILFVPAGSTSVTFTLNTARVTADTLATITATLGDVTLSDQVTVLRRR